MSIFDESKLRETCGSDRSFLALVLDEFVRSGKECLERAREAATQGDTDSVYRTLHTLKGSACTVGAVEVSEIAGRWENQVHREGLRDIESGLQELDQAWQRFLIHLDEHREAA